MIGQTISHYRVLRRLGQGGMGEVYLAEDVRLGHEVAIKKLPSHLTRDAKHRKRFEREAKAVAKLRHPAIVPLNEFDEVEGELYLVTEYLPGGSLRDQVRENQGRIPVETVLRWGVQAAEGLAEAHERGILHRDIKPDNLLLTEKGDLRIADFGLARLESETQMTQPGTVMGTLGYMAPEQVRGEESAATADLFALGATLYELITGESAFYGDNRAAVVHAILTREPRPVSESKPEIPAELSDLIQQLLDKDAMRRPQSAAQLARRFREIADACDLGATMPMPALASRSSRPPRVAVLFASVLLAVLAVSAWYVWRPSSEEAMPEVSHRIAVFPFTVGVGDDWISEGMAQVLSSKLDDAGILQTVDFNALIAQIRMNDEQTLDAVTGRELARQLDAGYFILGNVVQSGERLHVDASMYAVAQPDAPVARAEAEGSSEEFLELANLLSIDLLKEYMGEDLRGSIDRESITTRSYPALKAFLQAEQLWRLGQASNATPFYEQAVALDPEFALAWLRLSVVNTWKPASVKNAETRKAARAACDQALEQRSRLSTRHQIWLDAYVDLLDEEFDRSIQRFGELLERYPDDVEGWDWMGSTKLLFNAWRHGNPVVIAKPDLEQALDLDPEYVNAGYHMFFIRMFEADGKIEGPWPVAVFTRDDLEAQAAVHEQWAELPDARLDNTEYFAIFSKNFAGAEWMTELRLDPKRHAETRGLGHITMAMLIAAQGEWDRAKAHFDAADAAMPTLALQYRALLAGLPILQVPEDEIRQLLERVARWNADELPETETAVLALQVHDKIQPVLKVYLLGLLSVRLGELASARDYAEQLATMGTGPREKRLAQDLSHSIQAQCLWQEGHLEEALLRFEQAEIKAWYEEYMYSPFYFQSMERYLRAELLLEMGREEEALRWYGSFAWCKGHEFIYQPHSNLRRGQIHDALGDTGNATKYYQRFIQDWENSDPRLRSLYEQARGRLNELE